MKPSKGIKMKKGEAKSSYALNSINISDIIKNGNLPTIGDCWYGPKILNKSELSNNFISNIINRRGPMMICFPDGVVNLDSRIDNSGNGYTIDGELPNITINEDIKIGSNTYEIKNGILSKK